MLVHHKQRDGYEHCDHQQHPINYQWVSKSIDKITKEMIAEIGVYEPHRHGILTEEMKHLPHAAIYIFELKNN